MYKLILENKVGNQLTFNDIGGAFTITEIEGLNPPSSTINTSEVALMDGQMFDSSKLNMRQLNIAFAIEKDAAANRIEVYKVLKSKQWIKTYYKSQYRDVSIEGYISEINIGYFEMKQVVTVSILCPSPYWQDAQQMVNELSQVQDVFHFPFYGVSEYTPETVNLEPFFDVPMSNTSYWSSRSFYTGVTYTDKDDGWASVDIVGSAAGVATLASPVAHALDSSSKTFTLLVEIKNFVASYGSMEWRVSFGTIGAYLAQLGASGYVFSKTIRDDTTFSVPVKVNDLSDGKYPTYLLSMSVDVGVSGDTASFDVRLSLYEGSYSGDYVAFETEGKNILFGYIDPTANVEVVNLGDVETGMVIELYATDSVTNPKIIDYLSGDFIGLNYTMQAADLITIDTRAGHKTVTLLRNAQTSNIFNSLMDGITWLQLPIGGGVYTYEVGSGDAINLQTSISFTNLYEGV